MPPSGSAPAKRLLKMRKSVSCLRPLSGSIPVKLFFEISNLLKASIARMPPSGSAPAKWLLGALKSVTFLSPLSGSIP
eukprot:5280995-Amphidinium_carterae.1